MDHKFICWTPPLLVVLRMYEVNQQISSDAQKVWNVPNKISAARLVLAVCVFLCLEMGAFTAGLILFLLAAGTDWLDGWYARKYDQVTKLGRVLDPFCDKILICGTYILLAIQMATSGAHFPWWARITGLIATVVVGRELLVTVLRSMIEGSGGDFSANMAGKLKMWFQCIAVVASLLALIYASEKIEGATVQTAQELVPAWIWWTMVIFIWLSVLSTLQSGWIYVKSASSFLFKEA